jgi:hypothetical protein
MNDEQALLNTNAAGDWLNDAVPGETPAHWRTALSNNRKTDRNPPYRVPYSTIGRGAFYTVSDLLEYAEFEKARRMGKMKLTGRAAEVMRAFGIGANGGSATGRKLNVTGINPQVDESTGKLFIQLITNEPLMVYRIEVEQAESIASELKEAIECCKRGSTK